MTKCMYALVYYVQHGILVLSLSRLQLNHKNCNPHVYFIPTILMIVGIKEFP